MVQFLITELEGNQENEAETTPPNQTEELLISEGHTSPASSVSCRVSDKPKGDVSVALPMISIYRVEDAELPFEALHDTENFAPAQLPESIPMDKVMSNIVTNLAFKEWSANARAIWFKDFKSPPSRAVISDSFWFCNCWYFKAGKHEDVEKRLFDRISANFVFLSEAIPPSRKDSFFRSYPDAVAQAVLFPMFLVYAKSRAHFGERFRRELVTRISYWTTGICPEFVDTSHWKLNLGGGDVLQATTSPAWQRGAEGPSSPGPGGSSQPILGQVSADSLAGRRASLAHRAPRPLQMLRYSPLVAHFLKTRKFSSVNFVRPLRMGLTSAEERSRLMDVKHSLLVERANMARRRCAELGAEYAELCAEVRRQEWQRQAQAQASKKRLEIRRKEVLRSDPHEYANYLVSLHLLQQGFGQSA